MTTTQLSCPCTPNLLDLELRTEVEVVVRRFDYTPAAWTIGWRCCRCGGTVGEDTEVTSQR